MYNLGSRATEYLDSGLFFEHNLPLASHPQVVSPSDFSFHKGVDYLTLIWGKSSLPGTQHGVLATLLVD